MSNNAPQRVVPVTLYTALPESPNQLYVVGSLDAPTFDLQRTVLLVDMKEGAIKLMAPFGCFVQLNLVAMLGNLALAAGRVNESKTRVATALDLH